MYNVLRAEVRGPTVVVLYLARFSRCVPLVMCVPLCMCPPPSHVCIMLSHDMQTCRVPSPAPAAAVRGGAPAGGMLGGAARGARVLREGAAGGKHCRTKIHRFRRTFSQTIASGQVGVQFLHEDGTHLTIASAFFDVYCMLSIVCCIFLLHGVFAISNRRVVV